ncbi:MAG: aminomethyl-transferring glycine dehydrogenase, partial [Tunicatimonas sp.]|uniref:aminomethyl-transferring glycine dehydrogenase n=1 Tax=Tunicatimonas sp. TaxID=1940096 RepID=UPI003C78962B
MKLSVQSYLPFEERHNGPDNNEVSSMLNAVGVESLDELISETVPASIRLKKPLALPEALTETGFLVQLRKVAQKNLVAKSYLGQGYYSCTTPAVIQRNILENPGWYTAYTPYQAEIAQGRLEALVNFQTMVMELTGMELANASLLDEATAAAEAMNMFYGLRKGDKKQATKFFVDKNTFPQTINVLRTRAEPLEIELIVASTDELDITDNQLFGMLLQYPDSDGAIHNHSALIQSAREYGVKVAMASDLLALTLLTPPGEMGADCVVGTTQRFGVPMGFGGPHAAFFATLEEYKRQVPGRIIGASVDNQGNPAFRMALQTREQHIKRDRATSNICTAQVLLAVMAGMFGVYHGPSGLRNIAQRTHGLTKLLDKGLQSLGLEQHNEHYFDTLKVSGIKQQELQEQADKHLMNFRYLADESIRISLDETTTLNDVENILSAFKDALKKDLSLNLEDEADNLSLDWPDALVRESDYLQHPVFNRYQSEHEMLRYIKQLENKDLSLVHSMIPLGSCTMKLNATTEMIPITWPEFGQLHPYAPASQTQGYQELAEKLKAWLCEITGFADVSLQPNSGAQGEFAGLMVIRSYHQQRNEGHRNIALIPTSAHGTNFASAVMAGMKVVLIKCDDHGNIDITDLQDKAEKHSENLASLMVTYPSTHGVFEEDIREICALVHQHGGQVYMDGANMNAQVGLTSPANIGADVCHLNLHKTFCIPHGGGGPGMGPIGVVEHLAPYLPENPANYDGEFNGAISAAPIGSASILPISYAYIAMMGGEGLTRATQ